MHLSCFSARSPVTGKRQRPTLLTLCAPAQSRRSEQPAGSLRWTKPSFFILLLPRNTDETLSPPLPSLLLLLLVLLLLLHLLTHSLARVSVVVSNRAQLLSPSGSLPVKGGRHCGFRTPYTPGLLRSSLPHPRLWYKTPPSRRASTLDPFRTLRTSSLAITYPLNRHPTLNPALRCTALTSSLVVDRASPPNAVLSTRRQTAKAISSFAPSAPRNLVPHFNSPIRHLASLSQAPCPPFTTQESRSTLRIEALLVRPSSPAKPALHKTNLLAVPLCTL